MKRLLLLLTLLPALLAAQSRTDYEVYYSPRMATEGLRVQVSARRAQAGDSTFFHYTNEVWGEKNLVGSLHELRGAAGYRFRLVPDSNRIVVYHPRTRDVRFSYAVRQSKPSYDESVFGRPWMTDAYFHVRGESLFAVPEAVMHGAAPNHDPDFAARIRWVGFPSGYTLHNNFASGASAQEFRGKLWGQFFQSLFVGGDYRVHRLPYHNRVVHVALRGQWQHYDEARLLSTLQASITAQRDFWRDARFDYYTVIMSPTVTRADSSFRGQSIKGTALYQGFMLQSSNNPYNNWNSLRHMFSHEMLHNWIAGQIQGAHAELSYWFTEGFTDYYAFKNRLRSNDLTLPGWVEAFNNQVFKSLYNNPERNQPNYLIRDNFWKSRHFEKLPYRRGAVFAFWLDNRILRKSGYTRSLDDLMRELLQACRQPGVKFTDEQFLTLAQRYLQEDISYFFQKHVLGGADIAFTPDDLMDGLGVDASQPLPVLKLTGNAASLRERYLNAGSLVKTVAAQ